jgi:hypothetical protein
MTDSANDSDDTVVEVERPRKQRRVEYYELEVMSGTRVSAKFPLLSTRQTVTTALLHYLNYCYSPTERSYKGARSPALGTSEVSG